MGSLRPRGARREAISPGARPSRWAHGLPDSPIRTASDHLNGTRRAREGIGALLRARVKPVAEVESESDDHHGDEKHTREGDQGDVAQRCANPARHGCSWFGQWVWQGGDKQAATTDQ